MGHQIYICQVGFSDSVLSKTTADDTNELAKRSGDFTAEMPSSPSKLSCIDCWHEMARVSRAFGFGVFYVSHSFLGGANSGELGQL